MNYAEQIRAFEEKRAATVAANQAIMEKAAAEGATLDAEQQVQFDENEADIAAIDKHLGNLRKMEAVSKASAKPVAGETEGEGSAAREGRIQIRAQEQLAPGIEFARLVKCFGMAKGSIDGAISIARGRYGESANAVGALTFMQQRGLSSITKAEVPAGANVAGNWATDLVGTETSAFADFVAFLRPQTILGKFGAGGIPALRTVPFRVPLITQTSGGEGYWVGEGKPKPLTSFGFSRTTLEPLKVANIAVLTKEMIRDSSPSAEMIVRDELAAALRQRLDIDFINPGKTASPGVSPASITAGAAAIASTGVDADDIRLDARALMQKFIDADNPPLSGVFVMSSSNALALSMMTNPLGQPEFTGIGMNGGTFMGLPVITSEHVPAGIVVLLNASDIYFADEGGISVDMSTEASLEMLDSGLQQDALTDVNATSLVSMFQTNSVAFLAERALNWARRRTSAVSYLTGANWGGAVPAS